MPRSKEQIQNELMEVTRQIVEANKAGDREKVAKLRTKQVALNAELSKLTK